VALRAAEPTMCISLNVFFLAGRFQIFVIVFGAKPKGKLNFFPVNEHASLSVAVPGNRITFAAKPIAIVFRHQCLSQSMVLNRAAFLT
jgi:hypothetical protein